MWPEGPCSLGRQTCDSPCGLHSGWRVGACVPVQPSPWDGGLSARSPGPEQGGSGFAPSRGSPDKHKAILNGVKKRKPLVLTEFKLINAQRWWRFDYEFMNMNTKTKNKATLILQSKAVNTGIWCSVWNKVTVRETMTKCYKILAELNKMTWLCLYLWIPVDF